MMTWFHQALPLMIVYSQWFFLVYFISINSGYLLLNFASIANLRSYIPGKALDDLPKIYSGLETPVTIIIPAFNEETTIAGSVHSMLQLSYPLFEIIVVNDGSSDKTLDVLKEKLGLLPFPEAYRSRLATQTIRQVYRSTRYPNVRVIDKENGGKADSLNAGINASRYPLFCVVDADSILQRNSLQRIVFPFLEDQRVVAAGGTVRVANGCKVSGGFLQEIGLPGNILALLQVVEYLRAFLFGRLGWSALGALLIVSGAFGVFRKEVVISAGGYRVDTVGEDMELIVRIHRLMREQNKTYRIVFLPDPVSWTEVPEDLGTLMKQRARWQRGLSESLFKNMGLMFSRNGGSPGWVAFPFMLIFEWLGPLIEVTGYVLVALLSYFGYISWSVTLVFLFASIGLGLLLSLSSLFLEEMSFHLYKRPQQLLWLIAAVFVENFGYRQLSSLWRLFGMIGWVFNRKGTWGKMKRTGNWQKDRVVHTP